MVNHGLEVFSVCCDSLLVAMQMFGQPGDELLQFGFRYFRIGDLGENHLVGRTAEQD